MIDLAPYIVDIARRLLGEPNHQLSSRTQLRFGSKGSIAVEVAGSKAGTWYDHENQVGGSGWEMLRLKGDVANGEIIPWLKRELGIEIEHNGNAAFKILARYPYRDEAGNLLFEVVRLHPKDFRQRHPNGNGSWIWKTKGIRKVLYRLPELITAPADQWVFIVEGEKDVDNLVKRKLVATTNPGGAAKATPEQTDKPKWRRDYNEFFRGKRVCILPDNDDCGRAHAAAIARNLAPLANDLRIVQLTGVPEKGDVSDWLAAGGSAETLLRMADNTPPFKEDKENGSNGARVGNPLKPTTPNGEDHRAIGVSLNDFYAYMPSHSYIFTPTREMWPAASVNARIPPIPADIDEKGKAKFTPASAWLDQNKPVEQMTWAPSLPMIIADKLIADGGWIPRTNVRCFNLYRPPIIKPGNAALASPWLDHVRRVFPDDANHIITWLAHRVQRPHEKINHALVLGGAQGVGKDTILEPVKRAIGPWNFSEPSPQQVMGRFNGFLKAVIMRINEARDLGEYDRFKFYDHMKAYTAAPPDVLRVDEKNLREHAVFNVCGVIITTNHKTDGIYLPSDDRRHYVAWSDLTKENFSDDYWTDLYRWYERGGDEHVTAYLASLDLASFNPKAPPPKTPAFWEIVDASRAPEDAELADALDLLGNPDTVTVSQVAYRTTEAFAEWLRDRRNSRRIPHRFEACGYVAVRNEHRTTGLWVVEGKRQIIYAKASLSVRDRIAAAQRAAGAR
jgi:hypothetical protein